MRAPATLAAALLVCSAPAFAQSSGVVTQAVTFKVQNPQEAFWITRTVRGTLYLPANNTRCAQTVILLLHGLSYARYAWDFPLQPETYSMARALAARGYPAVAIDELGYGTSDHPSGYTLTVEAYGAITTQIVKQLKAARYGNVAPIAFQRVVLFGHSAGTEMAELAAAQTPVEGVIAGAYTHEPSAGILLDVLTGDTVNALLRDYVYFGGGANHRAGYMFNLLQADPAIVSADTQRANLTPSGQILTISNQPSRASMALITAPVLLILAENDQLFPPYLAGVSIANAELLLFAASMDRTLHVVPGAGHTFMLHPTAPQTQQLVGDWLATRYPGCAL